MSAAPFKRPLPKALLASGVLVAVGGTVALAAEGIQGVLGG